MCFRRSTDVPVQHPDLEGEGLAEAARTHATMIGKRLNAGSTRGGTVLRGKATKMLKVTLGNIMEGLTIEL